MRYKKQIQKYYEALIPTNLMLSAEYKKLQKQNQKQLQKRKQLQNIILKTTYASTKLKDIKDLIVRWLKKKITLKSC